MNKSKKSGAGRECGSPSLLGIPPDPGKAGSDPASGRRAAFLGKLHKFKHFFAKFLCNLPIDKIPQLWYN